MRESGLQRAARVSKGGSKPLRVVTLRMPGGTRWRLTWRREPACWRVVVAVHRANPRGRRTLVALVWRRPDGAPELRLTPRCRPPAADDLANLLRAIERHS